MPKGTLLLDFVRYHQHLTGTKIGCREGDCGACSVLVGEVKNGELVYQGSPHEITEDWFRKIYGENAKEVY